MCIGLVKWQGIRRLTFDLEELLDVNACAFSTGGY